MKGFLKNKVTSLRKADSMDATLRAMKPFRAKSLTARLKGFAASMVNATMDAANPNKMMTKKNAISFLKTISIKN